MHHVHRRNASSLLRDRHLFLLLQCRFISLVLAATAPDEKERGKEEEDERQQPGGAHASGDGGTLHEKSVHRGGGGVRRLIVQRRDEGERRDLGRRYQLAAQRRVRHGERDTSPENGVANRDQKSAVAQPHHRQPRDGRGRLTLEEAAHTAAAAPGARARVKRPRRRHPKGTHVHYRYRVFWIVRLQHRQGPVILYLPQLRRIVGRGYPMCV
mmetsp:Transcript_13091/g.43148  ORF Transcript_13091/g.43148 Transcript_13091/m.43148 type:complete len:212 (-) Transcript_13091:34-669(-)